MAFHNDVNIVQCVRTDRIGFWAQLTEASSRLRSVDIIVLALILAFGAFHLFCSERASDFLGEDVFYADAARSLLDHGFYGINGYAETNMPPGVSAILAILSIAGGTHVVFLRAMAVFGTLGFLASYELLRRQTSRVVAASICLLLISSQQYFGLATQWLTSSCPYFFTTIGALLVARKFERATHLSSRIGWGALLTALIVASLMLASAAIAFLGAIVASICVIAFPDRQLALARFRKYSAVVLVAILVQGVWMHRREEASAGIAAIEWPVPGFPQSYVSQLKVKSGNHPELGIATLSDIPIRILKNAYQHCNLLSEMLIHWPVSVAWMSILTLGALILIVLGWCDSVRTAGGLLQDWYFAGYEFIYLLWPWDQQPRFFLPVAPLACLYMWRGGKALAFLAKTKPRMLGIVWLPLAISLMMFSAWLWMHRSGRTGHSPHAGWQDEVCVAIWFLSAMLAAWMVWADTAWFRPASTILRWRSRSIGALQIDAMRISRFLGVVVVVILIAKGLAMQIEIGRANLDLNSITNRVSPDAEAGAWIRSHTSANAVVMARHVPTVYHYSNKKIVWFPLTSNAQVLMEGILRHKVDFVIVVQRGEDTYYLPSDNDCFSPLLMAYPNVFRLVHETSEFRIFQVVPPSHGPPAVGP